jgi:uncharacterized protein with HEPN domain
MSANKDASSIRHMLDHSREAVSMASGRTRADLEADRMLNLSLVRLLEVVGEAAGRVSGETQARLEDIPWHEIIGLRNRLIHGYDMVDFDILWEVVSNDLPGLIEALDKAIADETHE